MKLPSVRIAALAAGLALLAAQAAAASGAAELPPTGRRIQPGPEIAAFFEARGVEAQYVGKSESQVPAEQWTIMQRIATTTDFFNDHADYTDYENDHDILNSMVFTQLASADYSIGNPVYMSIGGITWSMEQEE